jgi:hypothetical protein
VSLDRAIAAADQEWRMTGACKGQFAVRFDDCTTGAHVRVAVEGAVELCVYTLEDRIGGLAAGDSLVEEQGNQRGEKRSGDAVTSGIGDPENGAVIVELAPAINVATDLDQRLVDGVYVPALEARRRGADDRLLGGAGDGEIGFLRLAPRGHLGVLRAHGGG